MEEREYRHMYEEEGFHWWYAGMRAIALALLPPDSLPPTPLVLDAGCGTGYNMEWLRQCYGAKVTGLDSSSHALDFCGRRGERSLVRADAALLPLYSNIYDLVICFDVITQLIDETARSQALREFQRILKPGGRLLLRVPAYEFLRSSHDEAVMTYHRYGKRELATATAAAGFRLLRLTGANTILFPAAVCWRVLKKIGLGPKGSDVRPITRGGGGLNGTLTLALNFEASILPHCSFPFGLSIFLLAVKDGESPGRT